MKELIADYLFNDEMKEKIIDALNENIDIPIISVKIKIVTSLGDLLVKSSKNKLDDKVWAKVKLQLLGKK